MGNSMNLDRNAPPPAFFAHPSSSPALKRPRLSFSLLLLLEWAASPSAPQGATNVRYAGCYRRTPCRGPGRTPLAAHSRPRQACCSFRRALPHHRHHSLELHQLESPPRFHPHPVQGPELKPPRPRRLVAPRWPRRLHRGPPAADARLAAVVSRHGRRRLSEHLLDRQRALEIRFHPLWRSHLQDELQPHAQAR